VSAGAHLLLPGDRGRLPMKTGDVLAIFDVHYHLPRPTSTSPAPVASRAWPPIRAAPRVAVSGKI